MNTRTALARRVIAALLLVLLTACHSWQPTTVSPQGWTPEERPSSVRVTLATGETVTVENPTVRNDSIVGATDADVGVASRDVGLLEVRRFSVGNTVGLVFLIPAGLAAALVVVILIACSGGDCVYGGGN